ncbi:MAG: glycoside hydrolase family 2 TIM barrel-domain containing protein, partial [Bacteroidales bacterium]
NNVVRESLRELKSPTNSAYDWAFAVYTLGIWKDVWLEATGSARIDWIGVVPSLFDNYSKANLNVLLDINSWSTIPAEISIKAACNDSKSDTVIIIQINEGKNHIESSLTMKNPSLWWPSGHGEQPLYDLQIEVRRRGESMIQDKKSTRFGIREISWEQVPGAPEDFINPLKLIVNGRAVRQMGSNLIPPDILFGRMNQRGPMLMEQAYDAGINCLRLWGGGVILSDTIYNRADELGIMLLQEFPLANTLPGTDSVFLTNLEQTAVNIVKQVRNHPSIVEWSGGNEMHWKQGTDHPALHILENAVQKHDDRFFRATEPAQGSGAHGTYTYVYHTKPAPYLSWLGAGKQNLYQRYNTSNEMRLSEFGTNSPAHLEVWQRTIPPSSHWPLEDYNDTVLIRKNVFWGAVLKENWLHKEITEDIFGSATGLEQLIKAGQFLGAEGLRYAMDALRRKGKSLGGGFMSWNFNEPWPNGAGSYMIDHDGRPLMNYYFVKQALSPVSLSLEYESLLYDPEDGVKVELFLVSDAPETVENMKWKWLARDCKGNVIAQEEGRASIDPIEVKSLGEINFIASAKNRFGPVFIELQLYDSSEKLLAERLHVFGPDGIASPLAGLLKKKEGRNVTKQAANKPEISGSQGNLANDVDSAKAGGKWSAVTRTSLELEAMPTGKDNDKEELHLIVSNTGSMTALFCEPHPLISYRTDLFIDNNYCFIPPGERRRINVRSSKKSDSRLTLAQTGWRITCWNADPLIIAPSSEVLVSLGRQDNMCREFAGYPGLSPAVKDSIISLSGRRPDPALIPCLFDQDKTIELEFKGRTGSQGRSGLLRINTSDQSTTSAMLSIELNGRSFGANLSAGYGFQKEDPAHLAEAGTVEIRIPEGIIKQGKNHLKIQVQGSGWFTWDSLDLRLN